MTAPLKLTGAQKQHIVISSTPSLALAEEFHVSARRVNQIRRAALKES